MVPDQPDRFRITTDEAAIDVDAVHAYLTRSYWATGIPKDLVAASLRTSLCFGLFDEGRQIGFARVVTDRATFAYLCDVYILEEYQGHGLGTRLMETVMAHPDLQGLRRLLLATRSAHSLYEKSGFVRLAKPEMFMEINRPEIYSR